MANTARLMAREIEPDVHLPYVRHVTETVISLSTRALMTTIRLDGIAWMFGSLDLRKAAYVVLGVAIVFGASEIVSTLTGGS